ncbi:MAG: hypothetical protein KJ065_20995 [Anaerolineae bacterium]|nr:hypothetical protein [Anaerolineae bacterium]
MTTQTVTHPSYAVVRNIVRRWERRQRLGQMFDWLPRTLVIALLIGIGIALVSRMRPWLLPGQIILATGIAAVVCLAVIYLAIWFWPRTLIESARRFDRLFQLKERTSTALELLVGSIHANDELMTYQLEDTLARASAIRPASYLPLQMRWREWGLVALLAASLALLILLPNVFAETISDNSAQQETIDEAAETLRDITRDLAADPTLENERREQLLEALRASIAILDEPDITPEEALAAVSSAEAMLSDQASELRQQSRSAQSSLEAAADALRDLQSLNNDPQSSQQSLSQTLESLSQQMQGFNDSQRQSAANAMNNAAQQMEQSSPAGAEALRQAGQQLQQGDTQGAQQQLQQAQQQAQQAEQQAQAQQNSAQQLGENANQAQEAGAQISQQQSSQQAQGQQQTQQAQSGAPNTSNNAQSQPNSQGGPQVPSNSQSGSQPGQQPDAQSAQSQPGESGQGGMQSQSPSGPPASGGQQSEQGNSQGSAQAGAGDTPGNAGQDTSGSQGQPPDQNNNPDGGGVRDFEPIYAPSRLGGEPGEDTVELEPDASQMPVIEGEFAQNPTGSTSVPYNQVFNDYANAVNRALESDYVPLGLRDVVRDYFTGLEPGQRSP